MRTTPLFSKVCLFVAAALLVGCSESIYHGLDEKEANEMIVALEQQGLEASKERDPSSEDAWKLVVPSATRVEAWHVLQAEGLPRPESSGFDEHYPTGGLVPTADEERILLQYSTAQELRDNLLAIDGVVDARVNLVLPEKPQLHLEETVVEPPRASVLVKYNGRSEEPPIDEEAVRKLVAGGVEGLDSEEVDIVLTRASSAGDPLEETELATVGPVSVAPESKGIFQVMVVGMSLCIVGLSAGLVYLVFRLRRRSKEESQR
ncbi:MAG: hypothetical protein ACOCV2_11240 [Persicimonas sp.]